MITDRTLARLPLGTELIALREVVGMAPWTSPPSGASSHSPGHPGDLPARRGRPLPCQGGQGGLSTIGPCRAVLVYLRVRVIRCWTGLAVGG